MRPRASNPCFYVPFTRILVLQPYLLIPVEGRCGVPLDPVEPVLPLLQPSVQHTVGHVNMLAQFRQDAAAYLPAVEELCGRWPRNGWAVSPLGKCQSPVTLFIFDLLKQSLHILYRLFASPVPAAVVSTRIRVDHPHSSCPCLESVSEFWAVVRF